MIVGKYVVNAPSDKEQLLPAIESVPLTIVEPENILADTGYFSADAIEAVGAKTGATVYCAVEKSGHHRTVSDLEEHTDPEPPPDDASIKEKMKQRLRTRKGRALYNLRKQTVEPVFGIIKEVIGFRQFSMRGLEKADLEWTLVCLSYNLKKLFKLQMDCVQIR